MTICAAVGCNSRSELTKTTNISLHRFPTKPEQRNAWIKAVRRVDWQPTKYSVLCSLHFDEKHFDRSYKILKLKENAIPTIFAAYPSYYRNQKEKECRRQLKRKIAEEEPGSSASVADCYASVVESTDSTPEVVSDTSATLEQKLSHVTSQYEKAKKRIKLLQQSTRRNKKKNAELQNIIDSLKQKNFTHEDNLEVLKRISGPNSEFLSRQVSKELGTPLPVKYSSELRAFALTLHFFSPRAYRYVRKIFNTCLPHERTIKKWYQSTEGKPGFTTEAFRVLKLIVEMGKSKEPEIHYLWNLVIDEVAIRKYVEWDGTSYHGYADFGTGLADDNLPVAKGALTFMLVCINSNWKLPIAYFLIDGVGSDQQCNLVKQALSLCFGVGADVVNVTFDGTSTNISMANKLGCCLEANRLHTSFFHPESKEPVSVMLDACHMIKLVRNTLGDKQHIVDKDGGVIKWEFIKKLHDLQETEGVHLANKLRKAHVEWRSQKMKVKLAVQVFSDSVADAIEQCKNMGLEDFAHSEATIKFIRVMNKLFDILNSRNMLQRNWKKPLFDNNYVEVRDFLRETHEYIASLKDHIGTKIIFSNRKVGFVGLQVCIESTLHLYERLVVNKDLKFLPLYKFSQDHLELFFSSVRSLGGCNNNPTARQFKAAYKKLLVHCELYEDSRGNCLKIEDISILQISSSVLSKVQQTSIELINMTCPRIRAVDTVEEEFVEDDDGLQNAYDLLDHDYTYDVEKITLICESAVAYIAGFVIKKLESKLKCESCLSVLREPKLLKAHSLIVQKNKGGLIFPSYDVIKICRQSEKIFRKTLSHKVTAHKQMNTTVLYMSSMVLHEFVGQSVFPILKEHMLEQAPSANHVIHLIKAIAQSYLEIRLRHWCKRFSMNLIETKQRQLFTKLILFKGE